MKAIAALFDLDALKASKNQDTDIAFALESLKKDTDYLYGSDQPISNLVGRTMPRSFSFGAMLVKE